MRLQIDSPIVGRLLNGVVYLSFFFFLFLDKGAVYLLKSSS